MGEDMRVDISKLSLEEKESLAGPKPLDTATHKYSFCQAYSKKKQKRTYFWRGCFRTAERTKSNWKRIYKKQVKIKKIFNQPEFNMIEFYEGVRESLIERNPEIDSNLELAEIVQLVPKEEITTGLAIQLNPHVTQLRSIVSKMEE